MHQGWENRFNRLSDELDLTADQKPKVQAIFEELRIKIEDARTNADTELQGVLTPEQYQKLQNHWQAHKRHWHNQQGNGEGGTNTDTNMDNSSSQ